MATIVLCKLGAVSASGKVYTITVGDLGKESNLDYLTPTATMVYGHKWNNGDARFSRYRKVSDSEYIDAYRQRCIRNKLLIVKFFKDELKDDETVTLCCYCGEGKFCHRQLVAKLIQSWFPQHTVVLH